MKRVVEMVREFKRILRRYVITNSSLAWLDPNARPCAFKNARLFRFFAQCCRLIFDFRREQGYAGDSRIDRFFQCQILPEFLGIVAGVDKFSGVTDIQSHFVFAQRQDRTCDPKIFAKQYGFKN